MIRFNNPNGLYSLDYPKQYVVSFEDEILSVSAPAGNSSLTVSTHQFDRILNDAEFGELFQRLTVKYEALHEPFFKNEDVVIQRLGSIKPNSNGDIIKTFWTICLKRAHHNVIIISVNVNETESKEVIEDYELMVSSIVN